ncbi:S-adenosyl-L-methionine-dependent methyltransferase [Thozetella sp. PMI_491]|nr:S-adenosyl-L-methionine-dependent methyltransferase [Thozetella sp. PMI_491]
MLSVVRARPVSLCRYQALRREQRRSAGTTIDRELGKATTPIAKKLAAAGLWKPRAKTKRLTVPDGDDARLNIVSENLCDEVLEYMKPSLERHVGCDLLDLYPGVGLWSKKLHDVLRPRSHILLEPNQLYKPFLDPILAQPNTRLVPRSGIVWKDLNSILSPEYLPHQVPHDPLSAEAPSRNDTLLVVGNIAFYPKRKWGEFPSLSSLLLFQFIRSLRSSSLFQKYGLVRMLFWVADEDKIPLLPRSVQKRKRLAIEAELTTDWITEIAGGDVTDEGRFRRWRSIDLEGAQAVAEKMRLAGRTVPPGRETKLFQELRQFGGTIEAGATTLPFHNELADLQEKFQAGAFGEDDPQFQRLRRLRWRGNQETVLGRKTVELTEEHRMIEDEVREAWAKSETGSREELDKRTRAALERHEAKLDGMTQLNFSKFWTARDNLHAFHQDPPILQWDRREAEPLVAHPTDFYPNGTACLLDIQPKAPHPLLREAQLGDTFDLLLPRLLSDAPPLEKIMDAFSPGAAEGVLSHCRSLRDPNRYGLPFLGKGELSSRAMNEHQFTDIMQSWKNWPFAPSYQDLMMHVSDGSEFLDDGPDHNSNRLSGSYDLS